MNPAASPRTGAKEAGAASPELGAADWIGRDRSGDLAIDRASANADFAIAGCAAGVVAVLPTENGRSGGSGGAPPISRAPPPAGSSGFADASLTVEGAGAGLPSRNVAISNASSVPSSGARPTYSTRTRAKPFE